MNTHSTASLELLTKILLAAEVIVVFSQSTTCSRPATAPTTIVQPVQPAIVTCSKGCSKYMWASWQSDMAKSCNRLVDAKLPPKYGCSPDAADAPDDASWVFGFNNIVVPRKCV